MNSENFKFWLEGFLAGVSGPLTLDHVRKIQDKLASVSGPLPSNPYSYFVPSWPYAPNPMPPIVTSGNIAVGPPATGSPHVTPTPNLQDILDKWRKDHPEEEKRWPVMPKVYYGAGDSDKVHCSG